MYNYSVLDLSYNQVKTLDDFPGEMPKLVKLSLKKNVMENLKGIENFPALTYLKLSRNNIGSLNDLKKLSGLKLLKGISLYKNPLAEEKQLYTVAVLAACPYLESLDHNPCADIRKKFQQDGILDDLPPSEVVDERPDTRPDSASGVASSSLGFNTGGGSGSNWAARNGSALVGQQSSTSGDGAGFKNQKLAMMKGFSKQTVKPNAPRVSSLEKSTGDNRERQIVQDAEFKFDEQPDDDEDTEKDVRTPGADDDDIFSLNPKALSTVKLAFEKKVKEKPCVIGSSSKKDEEIWLGSPTHPIGYFKRVSNSNYKVVGDGLWMLMASKTIVIKLIEEVIL